MTTPALLRVTSLGKSFGGVRAVDGVSFTLGPDELLAMIGPNGAGKSTTFNLLNGQLRADTGSALLATQAGTQELVGLSPRAIWRCGVGRTFQVAETFASLTVLENVQMALLAADRQLLTLRFRATLYRAADALALLLQVGMAAQAARPCSALAYGDLKRVELAMALAHQPQLLLMDEPTAGMAPEERHALMVLVRSLVKSRGLSVLFTEHSMDVVFGYADRVMVLARGRVIATGTPEEIRENPEVQSVYLGVGPTAADRLWEAPACQCR